ncbi:TPA: LPXTG cell wall anchor domain-containing protein, partial [Streptococcus suis]
TPPVTPSVTPPVTPPVTPEEPSLPSGVALPNTGVTDDSIPLTFLGLATGLIGLLSLLKKKEEK